MTQTTQVRHAVAVPELSARGRLLWRFCDALDGANVPYCITHGYDGYPERIESDVDCLMPPEVLPHRLARVLRDNRGQLGAEIVQWFGGVAAHFIVLATREADGSRSFLQLHVSTACEVRRRVLFPANEVLGKRRRHRFFWTPAPEHEFVSSLARRIEKGMLDEHHARRLDELYRQDPAGCRRQTAMLYGTGNAQRIASAAESADWGPLRREIASLCRRQVRRTSWHHPIRLAVQALGGTAGVVKRWLRADRGLHVVILGPDGSGKSSVVEAVRQDTEAMFNGSIRRTFPPALLQRTARAGTNSTPHEVRPRSFASSVIRAVGYWLVYYTIGHPFTVGRDKARGMLVLNDRHLCDVLVDPRRYRYGGPMGLLRLIWRLARKPDLVILLDAPAPIVQARKQEVPLAETLRQVQAYRNLVESMPNGHIIDAARPLAEVSADVTERIVEFMSARIARRFGGGR